MTLEAICGEIKIEKSVMRYFADNGILKSGELDDKQLKKIGMIVLFLKVGLTKENVVKYFQCDVKCGREKILRTLRESLLDDIHNRQKQLDKIDYVLHELQTNKSI